MTGAKDALGYNSPEAKAVTFLNKTGVLKNLNDFAKGYTEAALSTWSKVAASICPASCSSFELASVDSAAYTPDVTENEVMLTISNPEADGVKVTGKTWANGPGWALSMDHITIVVPDNCAILSVTYHCGYFTTGDFGYPELTDYDPAFLDRYDCTFNIPIDDVVRELSTKTDRESSQYVESVTVKYCETSVTGSILTQGNVWIICAVGTAAVIALGAIVIVKKKRAEG